MKNMVLLHGDDDDGDRRLGILAWAIGPWLCKISYLFEVTADDWAVCCVNGIPRKLHKNK